MKSKTDAWHPLEKMMQEEKQYLVDVSTDSEWGDAPSVAEFTMNESDAKEIVRLAGIVKENDLHRVERFDYRVSYLKQDPENLDEDELDEECENEARVDCDCISISSTEFWFTAFEKYTGIEYVASRQPIKDLADHFGIEFTV